MFLFWGPERIQIYNDAYRPSLGEAGRHPGALGMRGEECWTDVWPVIASDLDAALLRAESTWYEDRLIPIERNGHLEPVWWTYSYSPVWDDDGHVGGVLVVCQETTQKVEVEQRLRATAAELAEQAEILRATTLTLEQRSAEAERAADLFRESESRLRTMIDALPTLAWTARANGYIDRYNARWYEFTGTTREDMEGWGWQSVHDPVKLPEVLSRWQHSIATGLPFEMTFPLRGADGQYRAFLTRVTPLKNADGVVQRWFGTNTDVEAAQVERGRAEEASERTARLQMLTAALAATVTVDDVAAVVVAEAVDATGAISAALFTLLPGKEEATTVRQSGLLPIVLDRYARFPLTMPGPAAQCLRSGEAVFVEDRDGPAGLLAQFPEMQEVWEAHHTHALATVPLTAAGEMVGAMSFTFDSPRRFSSEDRAFFLALGQQAAQALERARLLNAERAARAAAEEANRARALLLSTVSHELRTPLNAIAGYSELLEMGIRGPLTEPQASDLARIRGASKHLLALIRDILDFARIESGRVAFQIDDVDIDAALADVEALTLLQANSRGIALEREPLSSADEHPLRLRADLERVGQILLNLVTNAIKFTAPGGRITLHYDVTPNVDARAVRIHVTDTGRGIAPEHLTRVFEPFVQIDRDLNASSHRGVGLGLAISRDLARGMGGDLTVESSIGVGSTFTLALPCL
ncbi:MAG: ATP-binding protein [Gemmatimonadota bacterium]|nr:ATP-binding protein [Gemmatimonadota bacterium]